MMECSSCGTQTGRSDRPHTYLMQEACSCPDCGAAVSVRVAARQGQVWNLFRCPQCGSKETLRHADVRAFLTEFQDRGRTGEDCVLKRTIAACPHCLELIEAEVVSRSGKVYFRKHCPDCGPSEALISEDVQHYLRAYAFARAGSMPFRFSTEAKLGCPQDCGLCNDHEQHTCLPIIEITDHCDLHCPICIASNRFSEHLAPEQFAEIIDGLVAREGHCDSIALSGGEPSTHPQILKLLDIATREEVGRVVLITNGIRLGQDRAFAEAIKAKGVYVSLQLDGFRPETHLALRGRDLRTEKAAALAMVKELQIPTQIIFVGARGVNEDEIGTMVDLFLREAHILSLNVQPAAFTGQGGGDFPHDPMDRLTIPGIIRAMEAQTGGILRSDDFFPLPCPHPQCVSLTYLLCLEDGRCVPFPRFADFTRHSTLLRNSATLPATEETHEALHEIIHDVFSRQDEIQDGRAILKALRRSLDVMFPDRALTPKESNRIGERQAKSIFIHHYMDRHNFDLERLRKCCHHYPQTDGKIMPACGYNLLRRGMAKGRLA